jgi:hypothetical protein
VDLLAINTTGFGDDQHNKNARSVVLRIGYQTRVVMLTGDATWETEEQIVKTHKTQGTLGALATDVLKVAHHGSHRTSNKVPWIQAVKPWAIVVSSDRWGELGEFPTHMIATGYRLPQQLTLDLYKQHSGRLLKTAEKHPYVGSYQRSDYMAYEITPDVSGDKIPDHVDRPPVEWTNPWSTDGIFTTLAVVGTGETKGKKEEDYDRGVQYRVEIGAKGDGSIDIFATDVFLEPKPQWPKPSDWAQK